MKTTEQAHTPTPWHIGIKPGPIIYGPKGEQIADMREVFLPEDEARANWKLVLTACNSHAELVESLNAILPWLDKAIEAGAFKDCVLPLAAEKLTANARNLLKSL